MKETIGQLPQEFVHRLKKIYPSDFEDIYKSFYKKRTSAFRINYLKTDLVSLKKILFDKRIRCKELVFPEGAFLLKSTLSEFQNTDIYQKGLVYVQNVSSMIPPIILNPQGKDKILDLCAAPGAKTTQIVSLAPDAEVIAVEKVRKRYYKLLANLKTQGADRVKVILIDGLWVRKKFPEYFDKILIDAPCSIEGRFCLADHHSYKFWKPRKIKEMVSTQKKLLHSAFSALKPGGILVYSTCTFSPEENEDVVEWFIDKFKDKIEALPIDIPLDNISDGLKQWKGRDFPAQYRMSKRIMPNEFMEGFFIAKLRKILE